MDVQDDARHHQRMASISRRPNGQYRARYRDDGGKEHARHFRRKVDARRWLDEVTTSMVTGRYVDPRAGRITLRTFAEDWRKAMPHGPNTARRIEYQLRLHVYPAIGDLPLAKIRTSTVQALMAGLDLAPRPAENIYRLLQQIFRAAVRDKVVADDPTEGVRLVARPAAEAWIPEPKQVLAVRKNLPARYRGVVDLVVGSGLRAAEVFGLEVDRLDFLRNREVRVDQQLLSVNPVQLSTPKTVESRRAVPLVDETLQRMSAHIAAYPPGAVPVLDATVPRVQETRAAALLFTTEAGNYVSAGAWGHYWQPAARAAGFPKRSGLHSLRHFYASALIRHGESAKVVQRRLGHSSAVITLRTYAHLWPDSDERTRAAVVDALRDLADSGRTEDDEHDVDQQG